jgi:hypothetical protein
MWKKILVILGCLVLAAIVVGAAGFAWLYFRQPATVPPSSIQVAMTPLRMARGQYIYGPWPIAGAAIRSAISRVSCLRQNTSREFALTLLRHDDRDPRPPEPFPRELPLGLHLLRVIRADLLIRRHPVRFLMEQRGRTLRRHLDDPSAGLSPLSAFEADQPDELRQRLFDGPDLLPVALQIRHDSPRGMRAQNAGNIPRSSFLLFVRHPRVNILDLQPRPLPSAADFTRDALPQFLELLPSQVSNQHVEFLSHPHHRLLRFNPLRRGAGP